MSLVTFFWVKLHRSDTSVARRWALYLCACFALMPTLGSSISFVVLGGVVVAWVYVGLDRARFQPLTRAEIWIGSIVVAYFLLGLISGLLSPNPMEGFKSSLSALGFVCILPLLPVLRYFCRPYWSGWVKRSVAVGCILVGMVALVEIVFRFQPRAETLTGNPLIMAYLAGAWTLASAYLGLSSKGADRGLLLFGAAMGLLSLFLSASRGPMVAVVVILSLVLLWRLAQGTATLLEAGFRLYQALCIVVIGYVVLDYTIGTSSLYSRFSVLFDFANDPDALYADSNLAIRWLMLTAGMEAFFQAPFFGYGRQNVMQIVQTIGGIDLPFTHLHNAFLTEAVANGILGPVTLIALLATPLIAGWRAPPPWRVVAILWVSFSYLAAFTNIGFNHDLKVFSYCLFIFWLNALPAPARHVSPSKSVRHQSVLTRQVFAEQPKFGPSSDQST